MGIDTKKNGKGADAAAGEETALSRVGALPQRTKSFVGDVRNEMRLVNRPSRKEVQATTAVVIITVFLFAIYFFAIDKVLGLGIDKLLRAFAR